MSRTRAIACGLLLGAGVVIALPASAGGTQFPVTGTLSINGTAGTLPDGGTFGPSLYDPGSGVLSAGAFAFPQSSISFPSDLGTVVVTFMFDQTNQSTGLVMADGNAALTEASLRLQVIGVTISGFPVPVGTCVFEPIVIALSGTTSAQGLDLAAQGFTIPPVASSDCGGNGDSINSAVAGDNNMIEENIAGDFPPPAGDDDAIFADGFDAQAPGRRDH